MQIIRGKEDGKIQTARFHITAADIVAIGAATSGEIDLGFSLPAGAVLLRSQIENAGDAAATLTTLTASLGTTSSVTDILAAATVFLSGATVETAPVDPLVAKTAAYPLYVGMVGDANLDTMTDLLGGLNVNVAWIEK